MGSDECSEGSGLTAVAGRARHAVPPSDFRPPLRKPVPTVIPWPLRHSRADGNPSRPTSQLTPIPPLLLPHSPFDVRRSFFDCVAPCRDSEEISCSQMESFFRVRVRVPRRCVRVRRVPRYRYRYRYRYRNAEIACNKREARHDHNMPCPPVIPAPQNTRDKLQRGSR